MFKELKIYSILLLSVPAAFVIAFASSSVHLSYIEWLNAIIYTTLCLITGIQLWKGKISGYWLSVILFGLASFTLQIGNLYLAAVYFLPNFTVTINSVISEQPVTMGFNWIPLAIFMHLLLSVRKPYMEKHNK